MVNKKVRKYETDEIIVYWEPDICEHAGECVKGAPKVFDVERRPWIKLDEEPYTKIENVIDKCPSKALSYKRK
ncbi:MAG: (4Fe-4S)-binding protein [Clostridium sp.]|nr:(4Fe-4S)-binding protein [Clostridium sp.]